MPCDACNTPTTPAIAAESRAYLTDPVSAPAQSCYTPPENPCSPPVSRLRNLGKYVPGWVQKLTPAAMGRLVIAVGDALHYFRPNNAGPLYFDGENVTVGAQSKLTAKATDASLVEYGHLTLAQKVSKPEVLPNGTAANLEYFEHGVQAVREIGFGEMLGLTADPANGSVRLDVIAPEEIDLIKKGRPSGFRRFGFTETQVEGGCGLQRVKKFYDYQGAVFGSDEILTDRNNGLPAVLVATKKNACGDWDFALATQEFNEVTGISGDEAEETNFRLPVIEPVYGDSACEGAITGFKTRHIEFPSILLSDGGYESVAPSSSWIFEADATTTLAEETATIDVSGYVPTDARYAYIFAEVAATADASVSSNNDARLTVHESGDPDNFLFRLIASAPVALTVDYKTGMFVVPLNADKEFFISTYLVKDAAGTPAGCYVKIKLVGWKR